MKKQFAARSCIAMLLALFFGQTAHLQPVQENLPHLTNVYAVTGATVVTAPGKKIENATIIIKNGLIQAVGANAKVPNTAYHVKADSLFVYAGFIDALGHTGIKDEKNDGPRPEIDDTGNPPNDLAGIQPERSVMPLLDPSHKSIDEMRKLGFGISHTVPEGRMLPGKGSLILLSGKSADEMVMKEDVSMYSQFRGASRMYPGTIIGVMAKFRNLYRNAENAAKHTMAYNAGNGVERPEYDRAVKALVPVTQKRLPVYFKTSDALSMHRALALKKELGFDIVLSDVSLATGLNNKLKDPGIKILMTLDLPEDKGKDSKKDDKKDDVKADDKKDDEKKEGEKKEGEKKEVVDKEREMLTKRRAESLMASYKQAGQLANNGITFSFSTLSAKSKDIMPNLRKMIENGLSEDQALAALTTNPATLLGISQNAGTVEPGKIANLVISTKPLFDEKTQVKYVFVDGDMYEYEIKPEKKKKEKGDAVASDKASSLAGVWSYSVEIPGDTQTGEIVIEGTDGEYSGTMSSDDENEELTLKGISFSNGTLTFSFDMEEGGQSMTINFEAEVDDAGTFEGNVSVGGFGTFPIEGEKKANPDRS